MGAPVIHLGFGLRLGWKGLPGTNTQAHSVCWSITQEKCCYNIGPWSLALSLDSHIKLTRQKPNQFKTFQSLRYP
jgi:hypothetical protein